MDLARPSAYSALSQDSEKEEQDLVEPVIVLEKRSRRITWTALIVTVVNVVLFSASLALFLKSKLQPVDQCSASPLEIHDSRPQGGLKFNEYIDRRFEFLSEKPIYSGPPTPEVDAAWEAITENKIMIVPDTDILANTSSRHALRGSNGHDTGVLAKFEGFHAIHCVNLLWRHTWPDYYTKEQESLKDFAAHYHLDHCADMLRQMLQCNMDFSIHTYYRSSNSIFGDFETLHQCQNYDTIMEYVEAHSWNEDYVEMLEGYEKNSA